LRPSADNILAIGSTALRFTTAFASTGFSIYKAASEANPTATLGDGVLNFGAGTTNAVDVGLKRSSGGVLYVTDGSSGAGDLNAHGLVIADTTTVTNLNADTVDGSHAAAFANVALSNLASVAINAAVNPGADNSIAVGTSALRFTTISASTGFSIYKAISEANPTATLGNGVLNFGAGTTNAVDAGIVRQGAGEIKITNGSTGWGGVISRYGDFYNSSSTPLVSIVGNYAAGYTSIALASSVPIFWAATDSFAGTADVGLARSAAGVLKVTDGSTGNGNVVASTAITAVGTAAANGYIRAGVYKRAWTNAEVVALGAVDDAELKIATLPAKTIVRNAYIVVDTRETHLTDLTVALGRTGATYIDYIVASDADVSAEALGSELVTNGTFTGNATGWTLGAGGGEPDWHYADNNVHHVSGTGTLTPSTPLVAVVGTQYKLQWTMSGYNALGTCTASFGGVSGTARSSDATFTEYFLATATTTLAFTPSTNFDGVVDTVILKEVARTVYGDLVTERGTNLTGYDLPSYTTTTDVYLNFVTTDGGHDLTNALQSTGTVYLMTETLP
jgi:hypothetical protein